MSRPATGTLVWWRFKSAAPCPWRFGFCAYEAGADLIRMGRWNGDITIGPVVSAYEIEWKEYRQS